MRVKTYVFSDLKEGMELIKAEYGSDTMIVDIKNNGKQMGRNVCEISIAVNDGAGEEPSDHEDVRRNAEAIWNHALELMKDRLTGIEEEMIRERTKSYPLPLRILFDKLVRNGFERHLALSMVSDVYSEIGSEAEDSVKAGGLLKKVMEGKIKIGDVTEGDDPVLMLGPTGAGKTQTTKKLARLFAAREKPVSILAYDPVAKGGYDDLVSFSEKHGIPFSFTTNEEDIGPIVERNKRRTIIDVTGYAELQRKVMEGVQDVLKLIVLPAGARDEKVKDYCERFGDSERTLIGFTKLDEDECLGHLGQNLMRVGYPVCVLTTGIGVDDLLLPDHDSFYKILLEGNTWKRNEKRILL